MAIWNVCRQILGLVVCQSVIVPSKDWPGPSSTGNTGHGHVKLVDTLDGFHELPGCQIVVLGKTLLEVEKVVLEIFDFNVLRLDERKFVCPQC